MHDLLIGGAGIFGLTVARQAAEAGHRVLVVDNRDHIGGNCASYFDEETGVEVHKYGSHIFHTNNEKVWEYVNRYSKWIPYYHRVKTLTQGKMVPLPFHIGTFNAVHDKIYTPDSLRAYIQGLPEQSGTSLEDVAISSVGRDVYEAVVRGYTKKQWGREPRDLPGATIKRLPVRYNYDDRYFTDKYQALPQDGYQAWLDKLADHKHIEVALQSDVSTYQDPSTPLLFTGPIDAYFSHKHGRLGWRSVDLEVSRPHTNDFQGCPVINYGNPRTPWTRIHEYKHYRPDRETTGTVIFREYSRETKPGEIGAYPVNTNEDRLILEKYRNEAAGLDNVWFGGRLGTYKYLDMHMAIASALTMWDNNIRTHLEST